MPLRAGLAGGRWVEPGGGDLGEFTFGKRWGFSKACLSLPFHSLRSRPLVEPERLSGRISSGASAPKPATEPRRFNEEWLRQQPETEGKRGAAHVGLPGSSF